MKNEKIIVLIPCSKIYAAKWLKWRDQECCRKFMPLEKSPVADLSKRLENSTSDLSDTDKKEYRWMIGYNDEIVGTVALTSVSWKMKYGEVSYMLDERFHNLGITTFAMKQLINKIFTETDLFRLQAIIDETNLASQRVAEKLGFLREGTLRKYFLINNVRKDQFIFGLLKPDFETDQ